MTITFPYSTGVLADKLVIQQCIWDIQRNDETDGSGDGRIWQAELASPLWLATITVDGRGLNQIKQAAALIRKLSGAQESFYLYDPSSQYPQSDPSGSVLGASSVEVNTIGTNGTSLSLKGLPAAYGITLGDKGHIDFGSDPTRRYFFEIDETVIANGSGVTAEFEVFPAVPSGVSANAAVTLIKPAAKMCIVPGSFNPGTMQGVINTGFTFKAVQRAR